MCEINLTLVNVCKKKNLVFFIFYSLVEKMDLNGPNGVILLL